MCWFCLFCFLGPGMSRKQSLIGNILGCALLHSLVIWKQNEWIQTFTDILKYSETPFYWTHKCYWACQWAIFYHAFFWGFLTKLQTIHHFQTALFNCWFPFTISSDQGKPQKGHYEAFLAYIQLQGRKMSAKQSLPRKFA